MLIGMQSFVQHLQGLWLYLERAQAVDVDKSTAKDSSCINQSPLHISTP